MALRDLRHAGPLACIPNWLNEVRARELYLEGTTKANYDYK
jgi:hypothetical protein